MNGRAPDTLTPPRLLPSPRRVQRIYFALLAGNTLAASLIWGINTVFLLDAGLSNFEAFAANAFFTLGMVIFEVPTGAIADTLGRRASYILGTITLASATLLYYLLWIMHSPFWAWAIISILLGLGFTFFSGAIDAWLVDALGATGFTGTLESVFGRAQVIGGVSMLAGSVLGGVIAQVTNLGVPFLIRAGILVITCVGAWLVMRDIGFVPVRGVKPGRAMKDVLSASIHHGFRRPGIRYIMLSAFFMSGVGIYVFYALQPYLLELWGDKTAYTVAGIAAAVVSSSRIFGGAIAARVRRRFPSRTALIATSAVVSGVVLLSVPFVQNFFVALVLLVIWSLVSAVAAPSRQAYLNDMIPSEHRATVLSFDSLFGSAGGVVIQPGLGRAADISGYPLSIAFGGLLQLFSVPLIVASGRRSGSANTAESMMQPSAEELTETTPGASAPPTLSK